MSDNPIVAKSFAFALRIIKLCRYLVDEHNNMARALQNADITEYWLQLIHFAELINEKEFDSIERDRKELAGMADQYRQNIERRIIVNRKLVNR